MNALSSSMLSSRYTDQLTSDALSFFQGTNEGGMGRWTYSKPNFWDDLVHNAQDYYLTQADINIISYHLATIANLLRRARLVCEIGPGSLEVIEQKTIPLLEAMNNNRDDIQYIAIDGSIESAEVSARFVSEKTGMVSSSAEEDFFAGLSQQYHRQPKALILLGSTIGNLPGSRDTSPKKALQDVLRRSAANLNAGDSLLFSFDTEHNEDKLNRAYNGPFNEAFCTSFLHFIKENCAIEGNFEPLFWRHASVLCTSTAQQSHIVFPQKDQSFTLAGVEINIAAGTRFVMNNSYKFYNREIDEAVREAGLEPRILTQQNNTMSVCVAHKPL